MDALLDQVTIRAIHFINFYNCVYCVESRNIERSKDIENRSNDDNASSIYENSCPLCWRK